MKRLLTILSLVVFTSSSFGTITTATSNGDWTEVAIWDNGVPGCFDTIVIPAGIQVDITSTINLEACPDSIVMFIYGTLDFQNGKKLQLPCLSDVLVFHGGFMGVGSGGGSSTYLQMCGTEYWNAAAGNLSGPVELCDGGCPPSQLPIELLNFTATLRNNERVVDLNWTTVSESENDYFTVERSQNGQNWEYVSTVDGAGNSTSTLHYADIDESPYMGVSYYRLKQTDFNGDFSYSPIASVEVFNENSVFVYPNPADQGSSISVSYVVVNFPEGFNGVSDLAIYSMDGRLVYQSTINVTEEKQTFVRLDESFAAGCYSIRTNFGNARFLVK